MGALIMADPLMRPERLSHTQRAVCSTHTPVTHRKEVVVYWPTAVRICGLRDVLDDPSSCFAFEDASSRLRGVARAVPVANTATIESEWRSLDSAPDLGSGSRRFESFLAYLCLVG